jgi:GTP:adenosylcobinamide-phosphate guanylyltransferase
MAILTLPPLIRPRLALKQVIDNVAQTQTNIASTKLDTRKFMFVMASVVTLNLLVIAGINILMTQDAFTLAHLKAERNIALDEKDAILNRVNQMNSPVNLARVARDMGMVPATEIGYLSYSQLNEVVIP